MKKLFLIFGFLITFLFTSLAVRANGNYLHTVTLEKNNKSYNIILGSDKPAKVVKKSPSDNELILELKGITSSDTVNALYKNVNNIENLVIENTAPNKLKIYISAKNIKDSTVISEPVSGGSEIVGEKAPVDKILWTVFVLAMFCVIFKVSKEITEEDDKILIKKDIKSREIELYKQYRNELISNPMINTGKDMKMRKMLKKIDRKIDERLTSTVK